ncbi:MAG: DUF4193 family protein [Acidimicrobiales bacterium]
MLHLPRRASMLPRHIITGKVGMADDLDDVAAPDDIDEDVIALEAVDADEDLDEVIGDESIDDGDDVDLSLDDIDAPIRPTPARAEEAEEEEEEDEEDEDVEASLDVILKERLVVEDEPEDDEVVDTDDRSEGTDQVLPKQPGEFVCRSCFLVKHPSQLADKKRLLCRDCV